MLDLILNFFTNASFNDLLVALMVFIGTMSTLAAALKGAAAAGLKLAKFTSTLVDDKIAQAILSFAECSTAVLARLADLVKHLGFHVKDTPKK